jgi:hypothetical protein
MRAQSYVLARIIEAETDGLRDTKFLNDAKRTAVEREHALALFPRFV